VHEILNDFLDSGRSHISVRMPARRNGPAGLLLPACRVRLHSGSGMPSVMHSGPVMHSVVQSMPKPMRADRYALLLALAAPDSRR
jgi:hypothetical protein